MPHSLVDTISLTPYGRDVIYEQYQTKIFYLKLQWGLVIRKIKIETHDIFIQKRF